MTRLEQTARTLGRRGSSMHMFLNWLNATGYRASQRPDLVRAFIAGRSEYENDAPLA